VAWQDLSDFDQEMYWAVHEEASLAEVPLGATDHGGRPPVQHGPWEPAACSARLLRWFDLGLVTLYDTRQGHPTNRPGIPGPPATRHGPTGLLAPETARELLVAWDQWGDDDEQWTCTRLVATDEGMQGLDEVVGLIPQGRESH
jgi:hypothetical protein